MKKYIKAIVTALIAMSLLTGCATVEYEDSGSKEDVKNTIETASNL